MSAPYTTQEGDVLDAICKAHYGTEAQVMAVLDANPGLAGLGPVLPAGVVITLPALPEPETRPQIRLW